MNAGIVILRDGTPCIVYDEALPYPVRIVEFSREDYQVTLVYKTPEGAPKEGRKFEFPLDHRFVALLEERKNVAVAKIKNDQLTEIQMFFVEFV